MILLSFHTEEKQVFAAAHELGHFLKVDQYVKENGNPDLNEEDIVNRFAAELLMPIDYFRNCFRTSIKKREDVNLSISMHDMLVCIVEQMNLFSVPYNAVVIRLVETSIISRKDGIMLVDGNEDISINKIHAIVDKIISNGEYGNLMTSSRKKEIKNLEELLNKAEMTGNVSKAKLERLRDMFGIVKDYDCFLNDVIRISEE